MSETQTPLDPYRAWDIVARLRDEIETLRRERDEAIARAEQAEQEEGKLLNAWLVAKAGWIEADDQIQGAAALLREAGEVLEPFANSLRSYHAASGDARLSGVNPRVGDLRRARALLAKIKEALNAPTNP